MKKVYLVSFLLITASLGWCSLKLSFAAKPGLSTGKVQQVVSAPEISTGTTEFTWTAATGNAMQEYTGNFDSWVVPTLTGIEPTAQISGVNQEVKDLINKRATQPKDTSKLTEEDISLMEQIIQKVQDLGK